MADFLTEQDCEPNLNSATVAGKVIKVDTITGKTIGLSFLVGYQKHWPSGGIQEIPIKCYVSGQDRVDKLDWLRTGEVVLVRGEVTDKGSVYALQLERLSLPERDASDDDAYLIGMQRTSTR
jgi:hypothetical protein